MICIKKERAWLRRFVAREEIDLVISDNRYGLAVPGVVSIFITHQLLIKTPFGAVAERLLQRMNYRFIRHFSRCWVPDVSGESALAGELSNPRRRPPVSTRYIGWLSRMRTTAVPSAGVDVLVVLSGPEPQRSVLERLVLRQAADISERIVLVRGLPGGGLEPGGLANKGLDHEALAQGGAVGDETAAAGAGPKVTVYNHLPAAQLEPLMAGAGLVIARSGYSTVMDLARMGKRAVLIPTPGQSEQEYLGSYLAKRGWAVCMDQKDFSLRAAVRMATMPVNWPVAETRLTEELRSVLEQLRPSALR